MIHRVKPEGNPSIFFYYSARALEFIMPTLIYLLVAGALFLVWRPLSILPTVIYAALLFYWIKLSLRNEPINWRWQSTLDEAEGSVELLDFYSELTEQMRRAKWIECGDEAVGGAGHDSAALYQHPLINLLRAPAAVARLFMFGEHYRHLRGCPTLVVLQYPDLLFSGSRDAWERIKMRLPTIVELKALAREANDERTRAFLDRLAAMNEQLAEPLNQTAARRIEEAGRREVEAEKRQREALNKIWVIADC